VFTYADDNNIFTEFKIQSLTRIKEILGEFKLISGLECNVDKSHLMPVGELGQILDDIVNLGFKIESKITILGLIIEQNSVEFEDSWKKIDEKIRNQIRFWERFFLSLPGRIRICKTMLYSQVNYLGCFLPVPEKWVERYQKQIDTGTYVMGRTKISRNKLYNSTETGGLGIFDLKTFLGAQKCSWVKRARKIDELWKIGLYRGSYGNILNLRSTNFKKSEEPILFGIVQSYEDFLSKYSLTEC